MKFYKTNKGLKSIILFLTLLLALGFKNQASSQLIIHNGNLYYLSHTIIIKLKSQPVIGLAKVQSLKEVLNSSLGQFKFSSVSAMFGTSSAETKIGLDRIMYVKFDDNADPLYVAEKIKKMGNIEWAEPKYVRRLTFIPNDPGFSQQYNLSIINAYKAWDISQGDTNVVIGIVDTGVDWPHPDLYQNIWHNWKDINSNWSDNDGFKYDSIGWDFGGAGDAEGNPTPDNNPIEDNPYHGTLVAGTASAVTNNGVGVAGIGFKCKIMAVKVTQGNETDPTTGLPGILYGFEGIKYAVDNGAKVINCSWGGSGFSNYEQNIIDYAVSKGTLVVAAAGNDGVSEFFYPASYNGVLSVAATDENDNKTSYSNFGPNVAVSAPGNDIFSTFQPNTYVSGSGTSFSSPLVAGLAALVFSHFPNYTPLQVAEQIRTNSDNIDAINPGYAYQLGKGRINAYNALANSNSESVRITDIRFSDLPPGGNGNGLNEPGETITVGINFTNYLRPIQNLSISLVSMNSYASVINGSFTINNVSTLGSFDNYNSKFSFTLANQIPYDETLQFRLDFTDGDYSDFQLFNVLVNPSFLTQSGNNITLTVNSRGNVGFNDYPVNLQGNGFTFMNGENMLFEGALIIGNSSGSTIRVEDAARGSDINYEDTSFNIIQPFKLIIPNDLSYERGITVFNDDNAPNKLGISTTLNSYTFAPDSDKNFIILKYSFTNTSQTAISNFYSGLFFDWDLGVDGEGDSTAYDNVGQMGYAWHPGGTFDTLVATALISSMNYGYWGILNDGSDGSFGIYDGFTPADKWQAISSGIGKAAAGLGDISEVTSGGPFTIPPGQTLNVGFAIAAGTNLNDLRTAVANARSKYQDILTDVNNDKNQIPAAYILNQNYPNPFNPSTVISWQLAVSSFVTLKIYDILGKEVATLINEKKSAGNYTINFNAASLPSGVYFYQLRAGSFLATKKMILLR